MYAPRRNWDSPQPPTRRLVCPLPPVSGGRGTLAGEKGVGRVLIPTRGIHCGTLYMYVLCVKGGKVQFVFTRPVFLGGWFTLTHEVTVNTLTQAQLLSHPNVPFTGSWLAFPQESIYWFLEDKPFLPSYYLASSPTPPPLSSVSSPGDTKEARERETAYWRERGVIGVWEEPNQIIRRRESLVFYKSFNTLCFALFSSTVRGGIYSLFQRRNSLFYTTYQK